MSTVSIEVAHGSAAELHDRDPFVAGVPAAPSLIICDVNRPALVLGSRQTTDLVDLDACSRAGIDVVRRRSGGGAVLLRPGAQVWIDVIIPHGGAPDDVRGSMVWTGEAWRGALVALGVDRSTLDVHREGMVTTPWSELVCFAGVGPGEVITGGRKLVGLSQRRTRHGIRVQCQLYRERIAAELPALFAVPTPRSVVPEPAILNDVDAATPSDSVIAAAVAKAIETTLV